MNIKKSQTNFLGYGVYWGIINLARSNYIFRIIIDVSAYIFYKLFRSGKIFYFQDKRYHYFYHPYNRTVASERIVEIPLAKRIIDYYKSRGKKILEVGNVLAHYFPIYHDVLDKYEKAPGVINKDVVSFNLKKKYDLIISISTMEHVGWTYGEKKDAGKFLRGTANLKKHLAKNGVIIVTFPLYYRDDLSKLIADKKMPFNKQYFMKRLSFLNEWRQVNFDDAMRGNAYDRYFANANVLYIGLYSKSSLASAFCYLSKSAKQSKKLNLFQLIKSFYSLVKAFFKDI